MRVMAGYCSFSSSALASAITLCPHVRYHRVSRDAGQRCCRDDGADCVRVALDAGAGETCQVLI